MARLRRDDLLAYLRRDWDSLAEANAEHWAAVRRRFGPSEGVRVAAMLRLQALAEHPEWPTADQREEDLACHVRVVGILARVGVRDC
jgi:hypothetical protein